MPIADLEDLRIDGDDLVFGPDGEPVMVRGLAVVEQDIRHALRESGLIQSLKGARPADLVLFIPRILRVVEDDPRVRPGTAKWQDADAGLRITATTMEHQALTVTI